MLSSSLAVLLSLLVPAPSAVPSFAFRTVGGGTVIVSVDKTAVRVVVGSDAVAAWSMVEASAGRRVGAGRRFHEGVVRADGTRSPSDVGRLPGVSRALEAIITDRGQILGLTGRVLVVLHEGADPEPILSAARVLGLRSLGQFVFGRVLALDSDETTAAELFRLCEVFRKQPGVLDAHPDFIREPRAEGPVDEPSFGMQWHLRNLGQGGKPGVDIRVAEAWQTTTGHPDTVVAVYDDGFDLKHEDLSTPGKVSPGAYDFGQYDDDPSPVYVDDDHGTAVAGIVAAAGSNGKGGSGVCPDCTLLPVRWGSTDFDNANAFAGVATLGACVINNSWSIQEPSQTLIVSIQAAATNGRGGKGTAVVFSAGNDKMQILNVVTLASVPEVITVSASDAWDQPASYTNFGDAVDVTAPVDGNWSIFTTDRRGQLGYSTGDYTDKFDGTSAAAPQVAGVIGLVCTVNPELTAEQIKDLIRSTAVKIGEGYDAKGHHPYFGFGRVDAAAAVAAAPGWDQGATGTCADLYACREGCVNEPCLGACDAEASVAALDQAADVEACVLPCKEKCTMLAFQKCAALKCGAALATCFGTVPAAVAAGFGEPTGSCAPDESDAGAGPSQEPGAPDVAQVGPSVIDGGGAAEADEVMAAPVRGDDGCRSTPGADSLALSAILVALAARRRGDLRGEAPQGRARGATFTPTPRKRTPCLHGADSTGIGLTRPAPRPRTRESARRP